MKHRLRQKKTSGYLKTAPVALALFLFCIISIAVSQTYRRPTVRLSVEPCYI